MRTDKEVKAMLGQIRRASSNRKEREKKNSWIEQLKPIIMDYRDGGEPLDGDEVESLCSLIRAKVNLHEGNITEDECNLILDGGQY